MILITGGAGFLGLTTAELLADAGKEVVITTRRRNDTMAMDLADAGDAITLEFCDLFNEYEVNELFGRYDFDAVIHTATAHMFASSRAANWVTDTTHSAWSQVGNPGAVRSVSHAKAPDFPALSGAPRRHVASCRLCP